MRLEKANDGKHKYKAIFDDGKITKFGAVGYPDYTMPASKGGHDKERRDRYRSRHSKDLMTHDPRRAGYLSYHLLWNKESLADSLADYKRRFNL
jgi:hypothetical protein